MLKIFETAERKNNQTRILYLVKSYFKSKGKKTFLDIKPEIIASKTALGDLTQRTFFKMKENDTR